MHRQRVIRLLNIVAVAAAALIFSACAASVDSVSITTVKLNNADGSADPTAVDSDDIPYGRSAIVNVHIIIDAPAGPNGYVLNTEL